MKVNKWTMSLAALGLISIPAKDLRLKILENADGLERAVKIRAKFGK